MTVARNKSTRRTPPPPTSAGTVLDAGGLPVETLAVLAHREGRRPVPIYHAHRWFARRFSAVFRALLVAARTRPGEDFLGRYYAGVDCSGLTVLDPFVGGGTSVVEAARLGAAAVGYDVDPVACAVTRFELAAAAVPDLEPAVGLLRRRAGRLARYYETAGPDGGPRRILHGFWVQVVPCGGCGVAVEAHPHFRLAFEAKGDRQWAFCRACHRVHELPLGAATFRCSGCRAETAIDPGPVVHGRLRCPGCKAEEDLIDVALRTSLPPGFRLFALETVPVPGPGRRVPMAGRAFQAAAATDQDRLRAARRSLGRRRTETGGWRWVPDREIPTEGRADDRLVRYGYRRYRELFNPRQLLHLSVLAEAIGGLRGPARDALALAFSDHLATNCMLTQYAFGWRRLAPLFSVRAYRHICRPVEVNPWLDGVGRGTFPNAARQVRRAVEFARSPWVAHHDGGTVPAGSLAGADATGVIHAGDSRDLAAVADASVDLILTDPPYCDNVAYSELSDFFRPWLEAFGLVPDGGSPGLPPNLAARGRSGAGLAAFRDGLAACFVQMRRVLKPDGRLAFSYQHKTGRAWEALAFALAAGTWRPVRVFPLLGNSTAGLHQHEGTILWDAITVCRRGDAAGYPASLAVDAAQVLAAVEATRAWARRLDAFRVVRFRDADADNLLRANLVAAALGAFGDRERPGGRPLPEVLEELPSLTS